MSLPRKRWSEHSARWQRRAEREGLTKARWDRWLSLSPETRKTAPARAYAAGKSVARLRRETLERAALANMTAQIQDGRVATMRLGVAHMTVDQLRWTAGASSAQIRRRAGMKIGERNPWWYRG